GLTLTSGDETLHSINLGEDQARALSCEPGSAAFFIERIGRIDDRAIEWRQTVIRGDRFTVSTSYPRAPRPSDRRCSLAPSPPLPGRAPLPHRPHPCLGRVPSRLQTG